ncbi:MAG: mannose-6-phosphate isomerase, class I [Desulfobacterales bacterium]
MISVCRLKNSIMDYAWGSRTAIPELMGKKAPSDVPQAELWMGAHPKAPSMVLWRKNWASLPDLIDRYPQEILGASAVQRFGRTLPFLFKILAAEKPLSIQAHPNRMQAETGFKRENRHRIPIDAVHRNYKDNNHKPECLCALTPFRALKGFRPVPEILKNFDIFFPDEFDDVKHVLLMRESREALKYMFERVTALEASRKETLVAHAVARTPDDPGQTAVSEWMRRLYREYPKDAGVLSPIFLNLVCLQPGEAVYLPAGELHAYLQGTAIEVMANSDNVLRGGLTNKHIDVNELIQVLTFDSGPVYPLVPRCVTPSATVYDCPAAEFSLACIQVDDRTSYESGRDRNVEILLCTKGRAVIRTTKGHEGMPITGGDSVLIPAGVIRYGITGNAVFYKAYVP